MTQASVLGSGHSQPSPSVSLGKGQHILQRSPLSWDLPARSGAGGHSGLTVWYLLAVRQPVPAPLGMQPRVTAGEGANAEQEA